MNTPRIDEQDDSARARPSGTGLSQAEPVSRLGPPSRIAAIFDAADLCERAWEADRQIDVRIAKALGLPNGPDSGWCNNHNGDYWTVDECAKRYTARLDDAMSLVPVDWEWSIENTGGETFGPYRVQMGCRIDIEAKTLPLAICCAALRAHAASAPRSGSTEGESAVPEGETPK